MGHKLSQAVCHFCLCLMSIRLAFWHLFRVMFDLTETKQTYCKIVDRNKMANPKLRCLHMHEILIHLNEAGTHLVDTVVIICVSLSHGLKGALCLLITPLRSLQRDMASALDREDKMRWKEMLKEGEEERQKVKACLKHTSVMHT